MVKKTLTLSLMLIATLSHIARAETPADLDDLQIAHVAYTADNIDIRYAHLALAKSKNPAVHEFARTMIRDHSAVNDRALALVAKLNVAPKDNFLSRQLNARADALVAERRHRPDNGRTVRFVCAAGDLERNSALVLPEFLLSRPV